MEESGFQRVAALSDLPEGTPVAVDVAGEEAVCLVRVGDAVFACADRCTHADFPMSDGDMVDDYVIECPLHGAQFDIRSGAVLEDPATEDLATFPVEIRGDEVFVEVRPATD